MALVVCICLTGGAAYAQNATWNGSTTDWNTPTNWTPNTVPSGTATFSATGSTAVDNASGLVAIGAITFDATAQAYSFTLINNPFLVNGTGVANNSANTQAFEVTDGTNLVFQNASSANSGTGAVAYTVDNGAFIFFNNTSNAGNANTTYTNNGIIEFEDSNSANGANFTNNTQIDFFSSSTAANSTITNAATGTVTFNNSATAANATINNSGTVDFNNSSTGGNASITNNTGATLTFNNTSSAGNSTIGNTGTLSFNDSSSAGASTITNNSGGSITFSNSSAGGTANITNDGGATLTFNDASSAGGATITNSGTASFNNSSTAGTANITNNGGATLTFNDTSTAGSATITNLASMAFNSSASAGSATITNVGPTGNLTFNNTSTAGTANVTNDSTLTFNDTSNAGSATIVNNQTATFNSSADAGAAIITNNLLLSFNNSSTADSATITTNSPGTTSFTGSSTGGNARFITNAGGTFDMSGLTDGGMTAGSIEGAGSYILGGNALTVGSNNLSTTVSGVISGVGGSLIKVGSGTLTLTNTDTYTGATTINAGALMVNGSIAASSGVTVNSGATLEGTGTVSSTTISSGGTLAPGNGTPGTAMTVNGSLAFLSGAMYLVQVNTATASLTNVTGTATLNGTVDAVFAPGNYTQKQYTILMANGGIIGTFTALDTFNLPANITASLSYSGNDVFLNLKASLPTTGLNVNQQNVANALNTFFNNGGALPPNFMTIFNLTGTNLANALTQLDGEVATGADKGAFLLLSEFLGVMLDPFVDGRIAGPGGPIGFAPDQEAAFPSDIALAYAGVLKAPPPATFTQRWTAWGSAFGGGEFTQGNAVIGSNNVNIEATGFAGGMDYHLTPDTVVGFGLSGGQTGWTLAQGLGTGRSDAFQAGLYGVSHAGPVYVAAAVAAAEHWMSTSRVALGDSLTASFNAQAYGGRLEAGYRYGGWSGVGVSPYAAVQVEAFHTPAYSEADLTGGGFGLSYAAQNATDTRSELGVRLDDLTAFQGMPLLLRARLAWAHDWTTNPALNAVFESLPGANFVVNGAATPPNSALVTVGGELRLTPQWTFLTKFDGQFASTAQTYAGSGTLRYSW